jgi:hypothetical protein
MKFVKLAKTALFTGLLLSSLIAQPLTTLAEAGPSGTGKTLSADLLGKETQVDVAPAYFNGRMLSASDLSSEQNASETGIDDAYFVQVERSTTTQ